MDLVITILGWIALCVISAYLLAIVGKIIFDAATADYKSLSGNSGWSFYSLMKDYTFADGTHFGVKVEE